MKRIALFALGLAVACSARPSILTVPSDTGRSIVVLPPNNLTGDPLLVSGTSLLEKYVLKTDRVTVPDVLAAEARQQLEQHGYTVVLPEVVDTALGNSIPTDINDASRLAAQHRLDGNLLYIEVRRWEPDAPFHPAFVIASIQLALINSSTGAVIWKVAHPSAPVPTPGVVNPGDAYITAARTLIAEMLAQQPH